MDADLLAILVCPETREPVRLADSALLARVNAAIGAGRVKSQSGRLVTEPLAAALVREDGKRLYPVRDGIPIMLIDESMPIDPLPAG